MVTVHYGVFCAGCGRFITFGHYQAEALGQNLSDLALGHDKIQCPHCLKESIYHQAELAYSLWQDGRESIYAQQTRISSINADEAAGDSWIGKSPK